MSAMLESWRQCVLCRCRAELAAAPGVFTVRTSGLIHSLAHECHRIAYLLRKGGLASSPGFTLCLSAGLFTAAFTPEVPSSPEVYSVPLSAVEFGAAVFTWLQMLLPRRSLCC